MDLQLPTSRDRNEWQVWLWNLPDEFVTQPQKLQFMLMIEARFNSFDPFLVIGDLLRNRALWRGVVMDRGNLIPAGATGTPGLSWLETDLIKLRDIGRGYWNVDTLFLLSEPSVADRLAELARNWHADEVGTIDGKDAGAVLGCPVRALTSIITVWWD